MKHYGLIGEKLDHSFSKDYFDTKFEKLGIEAEYQNFEFENLIDLRSFFGKNEVSGLNVTIPFKEEVMSYLDQIDDVAKEIGAVNTIAIREGKWIGYNTDYYGFMTSLKPFLNNKHERALILGSGGASKAVRYALDQLGIPYNIVSRKNGDLKYDEVNSYVMQACKLIINTTPVGTWPNVDECPEIPFDEVGKNHLFFDLIYNPEKTTFLKRAEEKGAILLNGMNMLKLQAEKSFSIWNS